MVCALKEKCTIDRGDRHHYGKNLHQQCKMRQFRAFYPHDKIKMHELYIAFDDAPRPDFGYALDRANRDKKKHKQK